MAVEAQRAGPGFCWRLISLKMDPVERSLCDLYEQEFGVCPCECVHACMLVCVLCVHMHVCVHMSASASRCQRC